MKQIKSSDIYFDLSVNKFAFNVNNWDSLQNLVYICKKIKMYLKSLFIKNFRGIEELFVTFNPKINVIIGSNGSCKTAVIDALRLFYQLGDNNYETRIAVKKEDFYQKKVEYTTGVTYMRQEPIDIIYVFDDIEDSQLGAYKSYEYLDEDGTMKARVHLTYTINKSKVIMSINAGCEKSETHPDPNTLSLFCHYYLEPLRDSTKRLLSTKDNLLGKVISRKVAKTPEAESNYKSIIASANNSLLEQPEVSETKEGINNNLKTILNGDENIIGLKIEENEIEYIVNVIKPYLPKESNGDFDGFKLWQNSLGYNNLIYIATVLSDIKDCNKDDPYALHALFIEEPEAHLHPQLQVNLYNFLLNANEDVNSQVFITTHSPTLTSRVPLENLILLKGNAYLINDCFTDRVNEKIKYDGNTCFTEKSILKFKKMLMRYLDVTRSQLFFAKGCLLVEGISEALLINKFSELHGSRLSDSQIEIVNLEGTAFTQFLLLFNSSDENKRLPMKLAVLTDGDQFTDSSKCDWNIDNLIADNFIKLNALRDNIQNGNKSGRIENLNNASNGQANIKICDGDKTLEYQICRANVHGKKQETISSSLFSYLKEVNRIDIAKVETYMDSLGESDYSDDEQMNIALLLWKCMPDKSEFAQGYVEYLDDLKSADKDVSFNVPQYIVNAIDFLTK